LPGYKRNVEAIRAAGQQVEGKADMYRFGELDVARVRRILNNDTSPEPVKPPGKPPQLCDGCQYRLVFETLRKRDCIVAGDIGCYTLGVLPPFEAMDSCVCMGASVSMAKAHPTRASGLHSTSRCGKGEEGFDNAEDRMLQGPA
jgi:TPP-dependent indolepyruvate ferredoxin oxidoreductase alpha subunit